MNMPSEDENIFKKFEATYRRFQVFVWAMVAIIFAQTIFLPPLHLPRPVTVTLALVPTLVMLVGVFGFLWWLVPQHPLVTQMRPAARNLARRVAYAILAYLAVFAAATWYYQVWHPSSALAMLAGLAPSLPLLFAIRAMLLFFKEEPDEFLRGRMQESWTIATGLCLALCTVWGFLDQFEVVPHLPLWAAFPLWACCLVPACWMRRDA